MRFGRYEILEELGRGQMGAVYLAKDVELDRNVALKVARVSASGSAKILKRMQVEAKAAAKIDHPLICKVYDAGEIDGIRFIALQYIKGEDLKQYMKREGRKLSVNEAVRLIIQILRALEAAHAQGVIHRDLKPDNVMLNKNREPVIMDFGLARQTIASSNAGLTQGMIVGTAAYMSPEQATGKAEEIDHRSDIYAVGSMLFEMLTGEWPFAGGAIEVMGKKCVQEPPSPLSLDPTLNPQVAAVCHKMIAKQKSDRFVASAEVIEALQAIDISEVPPPPKRAGAAQPASSFEFNFGSAAPIDRSPPKLTKRPGRKRSNTGSSTGFLTQCARRWNQTNPFLKTLLYGVLAVIVFAAVAVLFFRNGETIVRIEILSEDILVSFQDKTFTLTEKDRSFRIEPGEQQLHIKSEGAEFDTAKFTIKKGAKPVVTVEIVESEIISKLGDAVIDRHPRKPTPPPVDPNVLAFERPEFAKWVGEAVAMPAESQLESVRSKLKELNPGFDGKLTGIDGKGAPQVENGDVTGIGLFTDEVLDLSPVRGLPKLSQLWCAGTQLGKGRLKDISPLQGMNLAFLRLHNTNVLDLKPLKGMRLSSIDIAGTPVKDLAPLRGMPLQRLNCLGSQISDLSPLVGMELNYLEFSETLVDDLSPIKGLPLQDVRFGQTRVVDLAPLREIRRLRIVHFPMTAVSDISRLRGMDLSEICLTPDNVKKGMDGLRQMSSLNAIWADNKKMTPEEFWKKYDTGDFGKPSLPRDQTSTWTEPATAGELRELAPGLRFRWCPPGQFMMGPLEPTNAESQVLVQLTRGFWLSETEVTQGQWTALMSTRPWKPYNCFMEGDQYPANWIEFGEAVAYCKKLTEQERAAGRLPASWEYSLPTEAQWEYACRAGTKTTFSYGDDENQLGDYAWYAKNTLEVGELYPHEVGSKASNPWGLKDVHGNVWEWCLDWYDEKLTGGADPSGPLTGTKRVRRGGPWFRGPDQCGSATRFFQEPGTRYHDFGFRIAAIPSSFNAQSEAAASVSFKNKRFKVFAEPITWRRAQARCMELRGHLVSIDSVEENDFVLKLAVEANLDAVWIGANDENEEGRWIWTTGKPLKYSCWLRGQPNNGMGNENYGQMIVKANWQNVKNQPGEWNDAPDVVERGFVCEWATNAPGNEPPTKVAPSPPKLKPPADANQFNGKRYKVFAEPITWLRAQAKCARLGGNLVAIESVEENDFVLKLATKANLEAVWIGANDENEEGRWVWATGKPLKYSCWLREQPNNWLGNENYGQMIVKANWQNIKNQPGEWNDAPDAIVRGFVCQWEEIPSVKNDFRTTASGLKYRILRSGTGQKPKGGSSVEVHYKGWLDSGNEFDNSYSGGKPRVFPMTEVIRGWSEGLKLISEGGMIELEVPSSLAYGEKSAGPIPANATLHFQIELLKVF